MNIIYEYIEYEYIEYIQQTVMRSFIPSEY